MEFTFAVPAGNWMTTETPFGTVTNPFYSRPTKAIRPFEDWDSAEDAAYDE